MELDIQGFLWETDDQATHKSYCYPPRYPNIGLGDHEIDEAYGTKEFG